MAIHWKIPFKSLTAGTDYTVNVYDSAFTGTPVVLYGAANPFETQEDDDEDPFTPVRTQSGYLRIVDTGEDASGNAFDWREMVPVRTTDRPVTLTDGGGTVLWAGYLQPQNFSSTLYGGVQEREFPVMCRLAALQGINVAGTPRTMENFAYMIREMFEALGHPAAVSAYRFHGENVPDALLKRLDRSNFVDSDGSRCSYFSALEDICRFFGWTARTLGRGVVFTAQDATYYYQFSPSEFDAEASGTSSGGGGSIISATLQGDIFRSTALDDTYIQGYKRVTVHADARPLGDTLFECFPSDVEDTLRDGGWQAIEHDDGYSWQSTNDATEVSCDDFEGEVSSSSYASFNLVFDYGSATTESGMRDVIRMKTFYVEGRAAYVTLASRMAHTFGNCRIGLAGTLYRGPKVLDAGAWTYGYVRIGIGASRDSALWLDTNRAVPQWSSSEVDIPVRWSGGSNTMELGILTTAGSDLDHRTWVENVICPYPGEGFVFIDLLGPLYMTGSHPYDIAGFAVKVKGYTRRDVPTWEGIGPTEAVSEKDYEASNSSRFEQDYDVDLIFATYKYTVFGSGRLLGSFLFDDEPEQGLADRIAAYWATSKRRLVIDIAAAALPSAPLDTMMTIAGSTMRATAIGRTWRDDVVRLTLTE